MIKHDVFYILLVILIILSVVKLADLVLFVSYNWRTKRALRRIYKRLNERRR